MSRPLFAVIGAVVGFAIGLILQFLYVGWNFSQPIPWILALILPAMAGAVIGFMLNIRVVAGLFVGGLSGFFAAFLFYGSSIALVASGFWTVAFVFGFAVVAESIAAVV